MLTKRNKQMLKMIAQASGFVTIHALMEKFNVSRRTIYYDIDAINSWLKDQYLPYLGYAYNTGFYMDDQTRSAVKQVLMDHLEVNDIFTAEDRRSMIFLMVCLSDRSIGTAIGKMDVINEGSSFFLSSITSSKSGYAIFSAGRAIPCSELSGI